MLLEQLREELSVARGRKQEIGSLFSFPQSHKVVGWLFFFLFFVKKGCVCLVFWLPQLTTLLEWPRVWSQENVYLPKPDGLPVPRFFAFPASFFFGRRKMYFWRIH